MALLTFDRVAKDYGTKPLLDDVSLVVEAGEKVGVIGANGAGKTTLLRLAAGAERPDHGRVLVAPGARVGWLPQRPEMDPALSVLDAVFAGEGPTARLVRDYESALHAAERDASATARLAALAAQMDAAGAWDLDAQARAVLDRLGLTDTGQPVGTLSGGQRKRVALARVLVERPDLLILDEPTNHLDAETVGWLEGWLRGWTGALLLVTHDRYVLDRVVDRMLEVSAGGVRRYAGGYARYVEAKAAEEATAAANEARRANLARRELEWLRRGAKARTSKSKARIDRAHALFDAAPDAPDAPLEIASASTRLGKKVVELHRVTHGYGGEPLIRDLTLEIPRGDRLGLLGANGAGKTTLLELIAGRLVPDAGTVERGPTVKVGYYDQESRALDDTQRLIDSVTDIAEHVTTADGQTVSASQMLERFLFPPAQQYTPVGLLSGGERRRLYLLHVLMGAPNVLLLDEPTNDLDIPTLVALEDYLDTFAGAVVVVSHDRYFLDRVVERMLRIEPGGRLREIAGAYSAWRDAEDAAARAAARETERRAASRAASPAAAAPSDAPRKLSYKERLELEAVEARIAEAEARQPEIEAALAANGADAARVLALSQELDALTARLEADVERWAELAERA